MVRPTLMYGASAGDGPPADLPELLCGIRSCSESHYGQHLLEFHRLVGTMPFVRQVFYLHAEAAESNFAPADLPTATRYSYADDSTRRFLRVHLNPARAQRGVGVGGNRPARQPKNGGLEAVGCFICPTTIAYKSGYRQLYIVHTVNGKELRFLVNPYPLFDGHMTAASVIHEPQSWGLRGEAETLGHIERTVMDVYGVAADLPGSLVMFNGVDAGATIPQHYHLHVMQHRQEDLFPLQLAAVEASRSNIARVISDFATGTLVEYVDHGDLYPLAFFRAVGLAGAQALAGVLSKWIELWPSATANLIAARENGEVTMYLVPRDRAFNRAPGMEGVPGGLEVLGELVFTTPSECERVLNNRITYRELWQMLRTLRPEHVGMLVPQ